MEIINYKKCSLGETAFSKKANILLKPSCNNKHNIGFNRTLLASAIFFAAHSTYADQVCGNFNLGAEYTCTESADRMHINIHSDIDRQNQDSSGINIYTSATPSSRVVVELNSDTTITSDNSGILINAITWNSNNPEVEIRTSGRIITGRDTDVDGADLREPEATSSGGFIIYNQTTVRETQHASIHMAGVSGGILALGVVNQDAGSEIINQSASRDTAAIYSKAEATEITTSGVIRSHVGDGIRLQDIEPEQRNTSGGFYIEDARGTFDVMLKSGSIVEGGTQGAGIQTYGGTASSIKIEQGATLGALSDIAINTSGYDYYYHDWDPNTWDPLLGVHNTTAAVTNITNAGTINGVVQLSSGQDSFVNDTTGIWNVRQWSDDSTRAAPIAISEFGGGTTELINLGQIVIASNQDGTASTTVFNNLNTFRNQGRITLSNGSTGDRFIINGNFVGDNGTLELDTHLGDDSSLSDLVTINGSVTGQTYLVINNSGGSGALTTADGIKIIEVSGTSDANSFILASPVKAGAYEYLLHQGGTSAPNDWYLRAYLNNSDLLYRRETANYVGAPYLNMEYGFDIAGSLHQRASDRNVSREEGIWGRIGGKTQDNRAGRFKYDTDTWFVQLGADLYNSQNDDMEITAGVMATIGQQNTDSQDTLRKLSALSTDTGSIDSKGYSLGGYYTIETHNGAYLDLIGQGTYYRNKYQSDYNASQSGYGFVASAEVGKLWELGSGLNLEPQAQIMYQYLHLNGFSDEISRIKSVSNSGVRSRVGLKLSQDLDNVKPYVQLDVVHSLTDAPSVQVADIKLSPDFTKTWWQAGAGLDVRITDYTSIYADARYHHSFNNDLEGYSGHLGIKTNF